MSIHFKNKYLRHLLVIGFIALFLSTASCLIVTGRVSSEPDSQYLINGEMVAALACNGYAADSHNARGIPKDIIYYTPCEGTKILRDPFIINYLFWFSVTLFITISYKLTQKRKARSKLAFLNQI
jgi:hypothetical protein